MAAVLALVLAGICAGTAMAAEPPTSYGAAATVDAAFVRVPLTKAPPTVDGVMSKGEWADASSFTGFWYDIGGGAFNYLAPSETQNTAYFMYDHDNLYVAVTYPVYPEGSWLKAKGRFPNVLLHPRYGVLGDDHVELELRPYHDPSRGFRLGLCRWDVNSLNTVCDWTWSLKRGSFDMTWQSRAVIRSKVDTKNWVTEFAIPFGPLKVGDYAGKDENGQPLVVLPPPDGTKYRFWLHCGLGGAGLPLTHVFDQHIWNTTKGQLVFDSTCVAFQINDLGPIMDDVIDVRLSVKNHSPRSETMRLGFFIESGEGLVYSSYEAAELSEGLLELRPGEERQLRLRKAFPGITKHGNVLWFDVRSAGRPAKILFRARLMRFNSRQGGEMEVTRPVLDPKTQKPVLDPNTGIPLREVQMRPYVELLPGMLLKARPKRTDFDAWLMVSHYDKRVFVVIDRGIAGASDEVGRAVEASLIVRRDDLEETQVAKAMATFRDAFAWFLLDIPNLAEGDSYKAEVLLFDQNKRIVGDKALGKFSYRGGAWKNNTLGLDDVVWEGMAPIRTDARGLETGKHRIAVSPQGLPSQIFVKPDLRELPLEKRDRAARLSDADLIELGRGPQLREPMRLEATIAGQPVPARLVRPAKLTRTGKSEVEYASAMAFGGLEAALNCRYDCDGSLHCRLDYGAKEPLEVDNLELVMPVAGLVDIAFAETGRGGMTAADTWECALPNHEGVVWDSTRSFRPLAYGRFVPWFWFGSGDRGFTFYCDSCEDWIIDATGSTMQLERDKAGNVTLRVRFVNHRATVQGRHTIPFTLLTHPAKDKPKNHRAAAWHYTLGPAWCAGYWVEPYDLPEEVLKKQWRQAAQAPAELPYEQAATWRKNEPPFFRYGKWRNAQAGFSAECPALDRMWEDKATYLFERQIRVGRRVGWHMDEYWPVGFGYSDNLAMNDGYIVPPQQLTKEAPLPWAGGYLTRHQRDHYKRLARIAKVNNVPLRHQSWSNNEATMLEPFWWSSFLVEECGAMHRSYEIDVITQFPSSVYRYLAHNFTGLVTAHMADATFGEYGDDKRLDRQLMGRALLNDIGLTPTGAHGIIYHKEDAVRLLTGLAEFGFFADREVEKLPYWRNAPYVRIGEKPSPESEVYVTVYRRPLPEGKGCQALFVVMNESAKPVELPLRLVDVKRLLGGANTLTAGEVRGQTPMPEALQDWWGRASDRQDNDATVLMDIESGDVVMAQPGGAEVYGPIYVPYHDFRVFMARHKEGN